MSRISVALATYNGERYLDEQIHSLVRQRLLPYELVVSDDGSTDATLVIVRSHEKSAPFPIRIIESDVRLGYRLNFRRACQACTGDLIALCDQDDIWRDDKLAVMATCFEESSVMLAYHNATVFDGTDTRPLHFAEYERASAGAPFKAVNGLLQVFRSELRKYDDLWDRSIDQNEGNVILAHDQWYFFLALLLGRVAFVDQPLLDYRQHGANTYGAKTNETRLDRLAMRLRHYGDQDEWAARSAESRAEIAEMISLKEQGKNLPKAVVEYRTLASRLRRRGQTYSAENFFKRIAMLTRSIAALDYQGGAWGFQKASIVRDLWSGVLWGKKSDPTRL